MADLKAQLEITADASGVEVGTNKAKRSLADLGATASAAGKQASSGLNEIGKGGDAAASKVDSATRSLINSIQRTTAAMEAGGKTGSDYFKVLASQRGVDVNALKPYLDQLDQTAAKQVKTGITAGQMSNALRGVPAQFTDIITSLQGGQQPLTVFLQQGGQLKDMFGGIGPAAKALGGFVLGLVNPFTIAAAAVGGLALAYSQGSEESKEYAKALILSGNAAGVTVDQLELMAQRIDQVTGTQAAAAEALTSFAAANNVASDNIERFATVALRMQSVTGQAVSATVKQFEELGKSPVDASVKLNETTNYLTSSIYQQIKALEDQGKSSEAAALAQKAYADALESRLPKVNEQLGILQAAWHSITGVAKEAWDAMRDVGRQTPVTQKIKELNDALNNIDNHKLPAGTLGGSRQEALRQQLVAQLGSLQYSQQQAQIEADSSKKLADQARARIQFDKDGLQFETNSAKMAREITKARNEGVAAGASQLEIDKRIADIQDKYKNKSAISAGIQIDKAKLGADISAIQKANDALTGSYANAEKILEAQRSAGLLSDSDYYEAKREFIRLNEEAEEAALQKEIARYQQEKLTGKDGIDNARKIAEAQAKIATLRADSSAKQEILTNQEESAAKRLQLSYLTARQAAQDYFDTLQRQQDRQLSGLGQGTQQRNYDAGVNQIEDRYSGQRRDLDNQRAQLELEGKFTDTARQQYDERLQIINEFQAKSIASFSEYYDKLIEKQGDWSLGAREGLQNYLDNSKNLFQQTEGLVTNAFKGMEDALVNFVMTGKLNFSDFAKSVIADIVRIQSRQALAGLASSIFGSYSGGTGSAGSAGAAASSASYSAAGGFDIPSGVNPVTQLHQREMVLPREQADVIRSLAKDGGGAGNGINVQVSVDASGSTVQGNSTSANDLGAKLGNAVRAVLVQEKRPGGILAT